MCGIVGILGKLDIVPHMVSALRSLEYRGYDSAGVATLVNGKIDRRRSVGKLTALETTLAEAPLSGLSGIGHSRWATHGQATVENAHPMVTDKVAIVHNGIIENFQSLKKEMSDKGYTFTSDTDTEVIAWLITDFIKEGASPQEALQKALKKMQGAYAIAVLFDGEDNLLLCARKGSPLVVGHGDGEMFIGSDAIALAPLTRKLTYLEEGDWAVITREGAEIFNEDGTPVTRPMSIVDITANAADKGNYSHFMQKEIYEQGEVLGRTLLHYVNPHAKEIEIPEAPFDWKEVSRITLIACGTSYHAAMVAKYWIEQIAKIPVDIDIASEFRYRAPVYASGGVAIFISQSGETIDTLEALRHAKAAKQRIVTIVNRPESSMAREADLVLETLVGPEIGVASTKAFTGQLVVLATLTLAIARSRGAITPEEEKAHICGLMGLSTHIKDVLRFAPQFRQIARSLVDHKDVLYMGRGTAYPIALEGALKLKEISYIHAEGYAAGEMKHGPIALIDTGTPVIVIAPHDDLMEKTLSNLEEVAARGAHVILLSDEEGHSKIRAEVTKVTLPNLGPLLAPIIYSIPIQLLAYDVAVFKGTDVDQPRNLAKSVTVE